MYDISKTSRGEVGLLYGVVFFFMRQQALIVAACDQVVVGLREIDTNKEIVA